MMKKITFLAIACVISTLFSVKAQTNLTGLITNPSFETGTATGWTGTGTTGYAWLGPNTDGDATKDGSYINGLWNASIGDAECSQTLTGLASGYYKVTALVTVSTGRLTNQRLFATSGTATKSMLFGASSNAAYSTANLAILGATETYSFGGNPESTVENGPFKKLSVINQVTSGSLTLGVRVSGKSSTLGYVFSNTSSGDAGFFKFDGFTLTEVSTVATLDSLTLSAGALDITFDPATYTYTATLPVGTTSVTPSVVPSAVGAAISGTGAVDVSSKTGKSTITVTSLDGTTTKTYTINYTVLSLSNDATLSALSTSTGTLYPAFSPTVTSYKVLVPVGTTTVTPLATKNNSKASVSGTSAVTLVDGKGTSSIAVTAENGTILTYTINYDQAYIANPSFETGDFTGWNWLGTTGYTWVAVSTDGDPSTKTGSYIAGVWNTTLGDVELSQTITGLQNGLYKVTADLMGSSNATTSRLTTQRLFANGECMLFGANTAYSTSNLTILGATESYSFGGYAETLSDDAPLQTLSVIAPVTNGTMTLGIRSNGATSALGYTFPNLTAGNGYGWFKVDNFTMTYAGNLTTGVSTVNNKSTYTVVDRKLIVSGPDSYVVYNIQGIKVAEVTVNASGAYVSLEPAIYIVKTTNNEAFKVFVR